MSQGSASSHSSRLSRALSPSLLTTNKKLELTKNLLELSSVLSLIGQTPGDRPRGLETISTQLVSPRLLAHHDKDVRLLTTCCIVDVLRIFAPEAPYSEDDLVRIFRVIIAQIRCLSTCDVQDSATGEKTLYILQSLAVVKSCVVPVGLAKNGVEGADGLVHELFDAIISSIRSEHTSEVGAHMGAVLQACVEEMDSIDPEVLDTLLHPLFPAQKTENPGAFALCQSVLRRCAATLAIPISNMVNQVILSSSEKHSEVSDNIYALIYELHKVSSDLLLRILPNLCIQLQLEDESVRLKAVKLLGRLFASSHAEYGSEFSRNFRDFLGRLNDISSAIRLETVASCVLILKRKPGLRSLVEELLAKKLRDVDGDIRLATLNALIDIALDEPSAISAALYMEMAERMKDRRPDVRKLSLTGLAKVYSKHLCPLFQPLTSGLSLLQNVAIADRLKPVPGFILSCWGYPDISTRHLVMESLQEQLLPSKGFDEEVVDQHRAAALIFLYQHISASERTILGAILSLKSRVGSSLDAVLRMRLHYQSEKKEESLLELKTAFYSLMSVLAPADKKTLLFEKFVTLKDKHIFRLLSQSTVPSNSVHELSRVRNDLRSRLDSKSAIGEYVGQVLETAFAGVINSGMITAVVGCVTQSCRNSSGKNEELQDISAFLTVIAKHLPQVQ